MLAPGEIISRKYNAWHTVSVLNKWQLILLGYVEVTDKLSSGGKFSVVLADTAERGI